jgi:hypothetical protein
MSAESSCVSVHASRIRNTKASRGSVMMSGDPVHTGPPRKDWWAKHVRSPQSHPRTARHGLSAAMLPHRHDDRPDQLSDWRTSPRNRRCMIPTAGELPGNVPSCDPERLTEWVLISLRLLLLWVILVCPIVAVPVRGRVAAHSRDGCVSLLHWRHGNWGGGMRYRCRIDTRKVSRRAECGKVV